MSVTISVVLDTRRLKLSNKKYPVKLRVTHERISEYYQTVFDLTKNDWEKLTSPRLNVELQTMRKKLQEIERDALTHADKIQPFNFQQFENLFIQLNSLIIQRKKRKIPIHTDSMEFDFTPFYKMFPILLEKADNANTISFTYTNYIKNLIRQEKIGSACSYQGSYMSLKKFRGNVSITTIDVPYLLEYENWLKYRDVSRTTIGIYLRPLRAIFNQAITDKIISKDNHYPFGRHKYVIPSSKGRKKALLISDIEKIFFYKAEDNLSKELEARDYWLFSYFGNGMNPKDIANLKFKNIEGNYIIFERAKTEYSQRNDPKPIEVFLNDDLKTIIEKRGNKNHSPNNYLFPVLEDDLTALQKFQRVKSFVRFINDTMKIIMQKIGLDKKATTYVARHTFSTVLKRSGASTEFIQEALGHSDIRTTENYLDSFEKETKKDFSMRLSSFKQLRDTRAEFTN